MHPLKQTLETLVCKELGISRSGFYAYLKRKNNKKDVTGLNVHSDQGFQYTSYDYHDMLPPKSACLVEAIVMTTPLWKAASLISRQEFSIHMIDELWKRYKDE